MQAEILIKILIEDRPDELSDANQEALASGSKWKDRIDASLKRAPDVAKILKPLKA